ncbi:hypothetical protein THOM_3079, partial [Trachipleistophora hominis]
VTIKHSETQCVSSHYLYSSRFKVITLMSDFTAAQLKKVEPYLKKLGLEVEVQNFTSNVINIIKTKKKYNVVFMDVLHNIITHNQCTEYDEVIDLYYSLKPSVLIIKALSTTLYMLPFLNNEQLKKLFVFNLGICNRKHEKEVATIAQATTIQMITTIRDERTDDLRAIIELLDEKNLFNLKLLKEVVAFIDKPINLRFETDDWEYKKEVIGLIDERNKFKIDIDYFMMYYDKNEEIILSAFLGCNRRNTNGNNKVIQNVSDQNVKLNQHILKDNDEVIKLLEPCIKNITFENSPLNTLRFIFIYTVCQKYHTNTINYIEVLAEKYEKSCYDTYLISIVGNVIKSCLVNDQKKNKIDFKKFNENVSGYFANEFCNESNNERKESNNEIESTNIDETQPGEEGSAVLPSCENEKDKNEDEDADEWHVNYDSGDSEHSDQNNGGEAVTGDMHMVQNQNDDDVALINPLLHFFVKAFPKETIELVSPLQLGTSWPIVVNNLSDSHILTLFTKPIADISNFILYNNRFVKEMYFATFKNLRENDFRNILLKLELCECESVVLEYYKKNGNEDVIIDYLMKRLQSSDESLDLPSCEKNNHMEQGYNESDSIGDNNSFMLTDSNNLVLKIVYQLIKIKVFKNLDFVFECLTKSTSNSLKFKVLGIISKKEQSTRLIKSIFCIVMDRNINLALAALELIRSIELNDTTYLYSLITLINDERLDVYDTTISILFSVLNGRMVEADLVDECLGEIVNRMERICFRKEYNGFDDKNDKEKNECIADGDSSRFIDVQKTDRSDNGEKNENLPAHDEKSCVTHTTKVVDAGNIISKSLIRKDLVDSHQIYEKFLLSSYLIANTLSPRQEKSVKFTFSELTNFLYLHQNINLSDSFFVFLSELFLKCEFICEEVVDFMLEYKKISYVLFVCYLRMIREVGMNYKNRVYEKMLRLFSIFLGSDVKNAAEQSTHINTPAISQPTLPGGDTTGQLANTRQDISNDLNTEFKIAGFNVKRSEIIDLLHSLSRFRSYEILQITKSLPQDIVLPFYIDWLPDPKIIETIGDGSQFGTESLNKLIKVKMDWEEKTSILQSLKIEKDNLETFIESSTEMMIEGFESLENERAVPNITCYNPIYDENEEMKENNTLCFGISNKIPSKKCDREKEKIIINYLTRYYDTLSKHQKLDSRSLEVFYRLSKVKKNNINVSFHAYNYLFLVKPDYLCVRIKEAIEEYLIDLMKYEHLFNRCKRDEIMYILERMDRETTLLVGKSIIELLKCKDLEIIEKVYCVLKSIY